VGRRAPQQLEAGVARNVIAKVRVRLDTIGGGGDAVIVTTPTG